MIYLMSKDDAKKIMNAYAESSNAENNIYYEKQSS